MNGSTLAPSVAAGRSFLAEAVRDFLTTGAVAPSSRHLAARLAEPLREQEGRPLDVLEAGAGTGSVTRAILSHLGPGSRLDVVEANPRFAARVRRLVHPQRAAEAGTGAPEAPQEPEGPEVRVHEAYVEQLETGRTYDVIVSGLPFANFAPEQVELIMEHYLRLLRPGGTLTYFAYRGTRVARSLMASRDATARHRAVEDTLDGYHRRHDAGCRTVWANLPPARAWRLSVPGPRRARVV